MREQGLLEVMVDQAMSQALSWNIIFEGVDVCQGIKADEIFTVFIDPVGLNWHTLPFPEGEGVQVPSVIQMKEIILDL